ncbi:MAG: pseudouridine-5-phosphate glycosidase [Micromonosporaceae bacterium]|nr:pseudouridine-5-phosphate glycosidase [Micromonosporaceae bacterium]
MTGFGLRYGTPVREALRAGAPVVALESTIVAHGLPRPDNLQVARQVEQVVREHGAVPATVGMIGGELVVGLDDPALARLAGGADVAKLSVRDLAVAAAAGADGATTVAATAAVAAAAGIAVFATGGLGGVHLDPGPGGNDRRLRSAPPAGGRGAARTFDESADLTTLAGTPIAVVCAGVKSILDVGATLERLETLGVAVAGYRTTRFPGFYVTDSGHELPWSLDSPEQVAAVLRAQRAQGTHRGALVVGNPLPVAEQLDPDWHDRVLAEGTARLAREGITGKQVTPFLLAHFHAATGGQSLAANVRIIRRNAALAAQVAVALAGRPAPATGAP